GNYRVTVSQDGVNIGGNIDVQLATSTSNLGSVVSDGVVAAEGNVLNGDTLGSQFTTFQVSNGVIFVDPTPMGTTIVGDHGTLTVLANGNYSYEPNDELGLDGLTDSFTYRLVHPNGDSVEADLTIRIDQADPVVESSLTMVADAGSGDLEAGTVVSAIDELVIPHLNLGDQGGLDDITDVISLEGVTNAVDEILDLADLGTAGSGLPIDVGLDDLVSGDHGLASDGDLEFGDILGIDDITTLPDVATDLVASVVEETTGGLLDGSALDGDVLNGGLLGGTISNLLHDDLLHHAGTSVI
ncbi:hypothetical protein F4695_004584, partial [Rhizobium soli]|nr:hypothetical protein [Rhizobium soli]